MRVADGSVQLDSGHPPPIPSQVEEYSSSPLACCVAVGTVQSPVMPLKTVPFSIAPWLYPPQLRDWFAFRAAMVAACHIWTPPAAGTTGAAVMMMDRTMARAARDMNPSSSFPDAGPGIGVCSGCPQKGLGSKLLTRRSVDHRHRRALEGVRAASGAVGQVDVVGTR